MKLPQANFKHFNCILVIPDNFVKIHMRYIINMLFNLGFKSMFIHVESVMATYAMAIPSAVVVDIGATKISVCCIEEGIIISKSVIRKNFGGDDMTQLLLRLIQHDKALHYFPPNLISLDYPFHKYLIEKVKHDFGTNEMSTSDIVKTCTLFMKDKDTKKGSVNKTCTQVQFNCSDALLYTC